MSTEPHFRAYLNPQPALSEAQQKVLVEKFAPAAIYSEARKQPREDWIGSLRVGDYALIPELFALAKAAGSQDKRYADLLMAKDAIHNDRHAIIIEASTGHRSDDRKQWAVMRDRAYAMLNGAIKSATAGKPALGFLDHEIQVMQAIMESRHYLNWPARRAAMIERGIPKPPGRTWCLSVLPKLAAKLGSLIEITPAIQTFKKAPSRRKLKPPSQVYFIGDGEAVKIGRSIKPYERVAGLSTAHHRKLRLLATMPGGAKEEKAMHAKFATYRINREWFRFSVEIDKFIRKLNRTGRGKRFIRKAAGE